MQKFDCCLPGIELGATLVARSFSGDKKHLQAILKASLAHKGLSVMDGSVIRLKKLGRDYDPTDKWAAKRLIHETEASGEVATGILYVEPNAPSFMDTWG